MVQSNKIFFLHIALLFCGVLCACSPSSASLLVGTWNNDFQNIAFQKNGIFEIHYTSTENIKGFRGIYRVQDDEISLVFQEGQLADNGWYAITDENQNFMEEKLRFIVDKTTLQTEVLSTGKTMEYRR